MKKFILAIFAMLSMNAFAISIPVTEGMVNSQVREQFPKTIKKIELSNPQIVFLDNKSVICIDGVPRIMFLDKTFKFCATFRPVWNAQLGRLEATHLELTDFDIEGVGSVSPATKVLLNEVMIGLEPLVLYKTDSWILKQITAVEVQKGTMYLKF